MPNYELHNWNNAKQWASMSGTPEEVARKLVAAWNDVSKMDPDSPYDFHTYPTTPQFYGALAHLISIVRANGRTKIVQNGIGDDLCQTCRACPPRVHR